MSHRFRSRIDLDDLNSTRKYHRVSAYTRSKLANLLFTYELQRRLVAAGAATEAFAAHPAGPAPELARNSPTAFRLAERAGRPFAQTPAMGAQPTLRAATDPAAVGGEYYGPGGVAHLWGHARVVRSNRDSHDLELARRLWDTSEALTSVTFPL